MALILCFTDEPFDHDESETSSVDLDGETESSSDDYDHNTNFTSEDSDEGTESDEDLDFGVAAAARTFWGNLSEQRGSSYEVSFNHPLVLNVQLTCAGRRGTTQPAAHCLRSRPPSTRLPLRCRRAIAYIGPPLGLPGQEPISSGPIQ
jgi:hypothetical protein